MSNQIMVKSVDKTTEFFTPERVHILENWNDAGDGAVSIARARLEPGITTQLHSLTGVTERYLVVRGRGEFENEEGDWIEVAAEDIIYIPAGRPQRIRNTGTDDLVFYCVCTPRFDPAAYVALGE